jgi:cytidylate kinase
LTRANRNGQRRRDGRVELALAQDEQIEASAEQREHADESRHHKPRSPAVDGLLFEDVHGKHFELRSSSFERLTV